MTRNPADLLLNEHLDYLKLTYRQRKLPALGRRKRRQPLEPSRLPGSAPSGRSSGTSTAHDCSADQSRPFSSHQDPGRLPLGLAQKNQSAPDPGPLPAEFHRRKSQRYFPGSGWPRHYAGHRTMPGGVAFSFERWAFGPAYLAAMISHSKGCGSKICALNDSVINFTCEVRGAHMRRPAQSPHRIVSSKTGRVRLYASPGPVPSAVLCEA